MKQFHKPPLSASDQLELLKQRGLVIADEQRAVRLLEVVTLFRLCPYMRPFEIGGGSHQFKEGARLSDIVKIYRFDGSLRRIIMEALERVEVAIRACISNHMCCKYRDSHWYLRADFFQKQYSHEGLLKEVREKKDKELEAFEREKNRISNSHASEEQKRGRIDSRMRDNYSRFYGATYGNPDLPPSWAIFEDLSMGTVSKMFQGLARDSDRKSIAHQFDVPGEVLVSWLHTLTFVRNICAHHGRLWNRELSVPPKLLKAWCLSEERNLPSPARRIYIVATILAYLMPRINPDTRWRERFLEFVEDHVNAPLQAMGFPAQWKEQSPWNK